MTRAAAIGTTILGTRKPVMCPCASFSTSVSGPGQKRSISRSAAAGTLGQRRRTSVTSETITVIGLLRGRPLMAYRRSTASGTVVATAIP